MLIWLELLPAEVRLIPKIRISSEERAEERSDMG